MNEELFLFSKNVFDFVLAAILLCLALPFILIFSTIIFIQTKEFPFFIQERGLTLESCRFKIYKLKTMKSQIVNVSASCTDIFFKNELTEFVTPFGRFLRKTGLDELPQLLNVLKGEMSFVGNRPLSLLDLEIMKNYFPKEYAVRGEKNLKPGITGYWQIFQNRYEGIENLIKQETFYNENYSIKLDIKILLLTLLIVFKGTHCDAILNSTKYKILTHTRLKTLKNGGYNIECTS